MRYHTSIALYLGSFASLLSAQGLSSIPPCYQDCIENSGSFNCNGIDLPCICRLSNGNFLPNVITCIRAYCDNNLDTNSLLEPLELGCNLVGVPIAPAAIANAQNIDQDSRTDTFTGRTIIQSTVASAGTTYIVAIPISVTSGPSGFSTSTGSPRTAVANVVTVPARTTSTRGTNIGGSAVNSDGASTNASDEGSFEESGSEGQPTGTATDQPVGATEATEGATSVESSPTETVSDTSGTSPSETSIPTPSGAADATQTAADAAGSATAGVEDEASQAGASATAVITGNGSPFSASSDALWLKASIWTTMGALAVAAVVGL